MRSVFFAANLLQAVETFHPQGDPSEDVDELQQPFSLVIFPIICSFAICVTSQLKEKSKGGGEAQRILH